LVLKIFSFSASNDMIQPIFVGGIFNFVIGGRVTEIDGIEFLFGLD
jgi:hypothetical protein